MKGGLRLDSIRPFHSKQILGLCNSHTLLNDSLLLVYYFSGEDLYFHCIVFPVCCCFIQYLQVQFQKKIQYRKKR